MTCMPAQSPRIEASEADTFFCCSNNIFHQRTVLRPISCHLSQQDSSAIVATRFYASKSRDAKADKYSKFMGTVLSVDVDVKSILLII